MRISLQNFSNNFQFPEIDNKENKLIISFIVSSIFLSIFLIGIYYYKRREIQRARIFHTKDETQVKTNNVFKSTQQKDQEKETSRPNSDGQGAKQRLSPSGIANQNNIVDKSEGEFAKEGKKEKDEQETIFPTTIQTTQSINTAQHQENMTLTQQDLPLDSTPVPAQEISNPADPIIADEDEECLDKGGDEEQGDQETIKTEITQDINQQDDLLSDSSPVDVQETSKPADSIITTNESEKEELDEEEEDEEEDIPPKTSDESRVLAHIMENFSNDALENVSLLDNAPADVRAERSKFPIPEEIRKTFNQLFKGSSYSIDNLPNYDISSETPPVRKKMTAPIMKGIMVKKGDVRPFIAIALDTQEKNSRKKSLFFLYQYKPTGPMRGWGYSLSLENKQLYSGCLFGQLTWVANSESPNSESPDFFGDLPITCPMSGLVITSQEKNFALLQKLIKNGKGEDKNGVVWSLPKF